MSNWLRTKSIKSTTIPGFLGDIESRLPDGHPYKDKDQMTWAHEGTHGINAKLRDGLNGFNVIYFLGGWAFSQEEPTTTLKIIAKSVPGALQGGVFELYLIEQQRYWNEQPLYILDEFSAYTNSVFVGNELSLSNDKVGYGFEKGIEMWGYLEVLNKIVPVGCIEFCRMRIGGMCDIGRDRWLSNYHERQIKLINEYVNDKT